MIFVIGIMTKKNLKTMNTMDKEFKIIGAHKRVKKRFDSFEEAEKYVIDKKLHPAEQDEKIEIEETIVKYHVLNIPFPGLSDEYKKQLIDILKDNINYIKGDLFIPRSLHNIYMYDEEEHTLYDKIVHEVIQNHFEVSDEDMKKYYEQYSWKSNIKAPFEDEIYNEEFENKFRIVILSKLFEEEDLENDAETEFKFIQTNYSPCHNINISIKGHLFQIRESDIRFNEGYVTGRNVSCVKTLDLTDDKYLKFIKNTVWQKK